MSKIKLTSLFCAALFVILLSLFLGSHVINPFQASDVEREILISIRLPRVIVAVLMGMALGASGAVLQGILKNPLADPYILGISSGAALSATLGLLSGVYIFWEIQHTVHCLYRCVFHQPHSRCFRLEGR